MRIGKHRGRINWRAGFMLITGLFLFFFLPAAFPFFSTPGAAVAAEEIAVAYTPDLQVDIYSGAAIVVDTTRLRRLYAKSADVRMNIPAASKIMTALLACERLPLDTQITISTVAAEAAVKENTSDNVALKTGDKYTLEYLLLRLIYYNSDAAALAIAEQISNVESKFVELMNAKAVSYTLGNTVYLNCTGRAVYQDAQTTIGSADNDGGLTAAPVPLQYTTTTDLARLVSYAMLDTNFSKLIRKSSEYLVLGGETLVPMRNEVQSIWTLSEDQITGALYCESENQAYMVAVGKINDISIILITAAGLPAQRYNDALGLVKSCAATYVQTPLVEAGEAFSSEKEKTVDGEDFGLVYKKTVLYIHPINDDFLESNIQYQSFGPHSRPIEQSLTVGQVIFHLKDGTSIAVDVSPDRQILSNITLLNQALNVLQNNNNLFYILLAASSILLIWMFVLAVAKVTRLVRLTLLVIFEKRSRR